MRFGNIADDSLRLGRGVRLGICGGLRGFVAKRESLGLAFTLPPGVALGKSFHSVWDAEFPVDKESPRRVFAHRIPAFPHGVVMGISWDFGVELGPRLQTI